MRDAFLAYNPPTIGDAERAEVMDTLQTPWVTTGPKTVAFEAALKARLEAPAVVALNSCTAGLHVGLVALGVGPGDEVIVPAMTFCATANVVEHVGAKPVLVDVCPDTLTLSPEAVAAAVTPRTKVILPVHYAGHPAQMDELDALAERHGLAVLEDAAHAITARYKGRLIGSRSNLAAFSFYATKNLTTVEGGCLTGDPALVEKARIIGHHGMNRDAWKRFDRSGTWYYEVVLPGFKYNLTDMQAAIGLVQLKRLAAFQARRREVVARYESGFKDLAALELPVELEWAHSSWHLYVIRLRTEALRIDRNAFIDGLKDRNIGTSVHYLPVHMHPFYRDKYGYRPEDNPVAAAAYERMISLPLHAGLSDGDVDDVIAAVRDLVALHSV
ncbi:DegT/DnrJ/EryC1/StrS family aminotransferase [Geothrix edaphica]|uniref:Spore coat polysaccharide biosynthesis protein SpsC n=1 Tax=Geothrix edaphica TaxID=2927976 RepID=A0ABQ5PV95_9BACT|nr:DegT/DnrJ/EryC1/StrS family aminotransferase [Geothrix edaphica]GLH66279.1 spore coat polysaccharide biosynthesis protein SpsC [Geothrix edaphica]